MNLENAKQSGCPIFRCCAVWLVATAIWHGVPPTANGVDPPLQMDGFGQIPELAEGTNTENPENAGLPTALTDNRQVGKPVKEAAPMPPGVASAGDCLAFSRPVGDGSQLITVINTSREWMAVYHIDRTGKITLTGSRPLAQDFAVEFNVNSPLPNEIRQLSRPAR